MRLLLLRHAKSSWGDTSLPDRDRPLNARGERAAALMGVWMAQAGRVPDRVLCSSARRTQETFQWLSLGLRAAPELEVRDDLYLASPARLLEAIASAPDSAASLLVIAHNPGIEDLTRALGIQGDAGALERAAAGMGTAHLADIAMEVSRWQDVGPGQGRLERLVRPKELV